MKETGVQPLYRERLYGDYAANLERQSKYNADACIERQQFEWRWSPFLPQRVDAPILDIGCGDGAFLCWLAARGYSNLHGTDRSLAQIQAARARGLAQVEIQEAQDFLRDVETHFEIISAQNVLEHLTRDELIATLDLVNRALRPGGRLWITVPNALSPLGPSVRWGDMTHELCFTPRSMAQVLAITGFRVETIWEVGPIPHGLKSCVRWLLWQALRGALHTWRLVEFGAAEPFAVYTHDMQVVAGKL